MSNGLWRRGKRGMVRLRRLGLAALLLGALASSPGFGAGGAAAAGTKITPHGTFAQFEITRDTASLIELQVSATPLTSSWVPTFVNPLYTGTSNPGSKFWNPNVHGLTPNTQYYYFVKATYGNSTTYSTGTFTTLKRRITVTFASITVHDDSDSWGAGELRFHFKVNGNWEPGLQYGEVSVGSDDTVHPNRTKVVANAPATLKLSVQGIDDDCDIGDAICGAGLGPYGNDAGSNSYVDWATANSGNIAINGVGFGESYSKPFTIFTKQHALKFTVSGTYSVTYVP